MRAIRHRVIQPLRPDDDAVLSQYLGERHDAPPGLHVPGAYELAPGVQVSGGLAVAALSSAP
jgi:hypothetical protein